MIGTIGVLERSADEGLLELEQVFTKLKKTDFRIRPEFLDERLRLHRERSKR